MFQDTLLIIKPNYLVKRKLLLVYLLKQGFLIKGERKTCFSPELAAEFYEYQTEDCCFMYKVILLSKGNSEAFVLAKDHAVEELKRAMLCYFCTLSEVEENVHVTQCPKEVRREISFIFPNYIHEPIIRCPEQIKSCVKKFLVESTLNALNDIVANPDKDLLKRLRKQLAESIILPNKKDLPDISNQCCHSFELNVPDSAQQITNTCTQYVKREEKVLSTDSSKTCCSFNYTTSSCVSCSSFGSEAVDLKQTCQQSLRKQTVVSDLSSISTDHAEPAVDFSKCIKN